MQKNKLLSTFGLTLTSALLLSACGGGDSADNTDSGEGSEGAQEEQVLNIVESAEIPTMDSTLTSDTVSFNVLNNVNEGLYRQGPDNDLVLGMAAEEPEVSDDGLTYTFKIREDATWSNGDPVTANDFVFSWKRLADPATAAEYAYMIDGVVKNATAILAGEMEPSELGVSATDDTTLVVELEKPVPYFESLLTLAMYLPQNEAYVTEQEGKYATNSDTMLYNGPFELEDWDGTGLNWSLVKNEEYWDAETVQLDRINVDVVKETSTALNLYDAGDIDRMRLSGDYVQTKQGDPELLEEPTSSVFYFKMNQARNGEDTPLANENIRKAIAMSFDKQGFADTVLQNGSVPANGLVPARLAADPESGEDFREQSGDLLSFDADQAADYWEAGLEELGEDSITLEMLGDDTENSKKSLEFMQAQLESNLPGLSIELRNVPFKVRLDADTNRDYDIQFAGWSADYADPINFLELFHTDNGNNKSGYSNEEYDALIESARSNVDDLEARWQDMLKAEEILMDTAGIAPVYQRAYAVLEKPYVKDIAVHLTGADYSYKWAHIEGKE
ncbi:oligopeptide ABC transporter substrate-binding protein [Marinilactibacillus psychrotolerans]|uniref:Oligopeptide ABC transporter, periplasmic oligopeptide-binding protein OppA (TC 3.A.1.5.1) n=1 Tax=Marinilactibacillus psychrotolerans 42ea TaxID=1255609 RepID=A0A1R4JH33_9LACT|nr:peptide ABC transporter substrate-binding protein [Marinilactibacillus psychrotolerans]GEQ32903.1 oligopeptide ABC transporter substrate-binding protein [Marinilactibacillus psychrotolerans]SJN31390.1 Oligopeptide ABC transporter, periplasmic oligopeptide-binding protein OppA (TC 3.A.1.5.1) [Marinilactibacillus psychrotolerans 42ea]